MRKKIATFSVNTLIFLISFLCALNSCSSQENRLKDSLNNIISDYLNKNSPPGLAVCVIKDGGIFWSNSYGHADIEKDIPMSRDVIINVASISKTITATAILQLWEKEELDLDADVNKYLEFTVRNPNFPEVPITIKQLLTHTSSINDSDEYGVSYICGDPTITLADWISNYFDSNGKYYDEKNNFSQLETKRKI